MNQFWLFSCLFLAVPLLGQDFTITKLPSQASVLSSSGHAVAVDPADPNHVFFTTNDGGILVTEDGGTTWADSGTNGLVARSPRGVAFDPQDSRRVYAGSVAGGIFKSEDHGRHLDSDGALYVSNFGDGPPGADRS